MKRHWWENCASVRRYMPEEDQVSIEQIIRELDDVAACGYQAVQITAPYKSAGFYPWWGLRPLDYFAVNQYLGDSVEDFRRLVVQCHQRDLYVMVFLNLGYADIDSELWKKACRDRRSQKDSPESRYFLWSETGIEGLLQEGNAHFKQGGSWQWSKEAQSYYWCFWKQDGIVEPQYNWADDGFRNYAGKILHFWLDFGIDGIILDAVNWYLNCDWQTIRKYAVDVIHSYPDAFCLPEGGSGFGDDPLLWLKEGGFDGVEDQPFESDLHWNGSAVMEAILSENIANLEQRLSALDEVRQYGGIAWSYIGWGPDWTVKRRLLAIAVLIGTGHMTEIIQSYLSEFEQKDYEALYRMLRAGRYKGMAPAQKRRRIKTCDDISCYACICSEDHWPVICVYNFQNESREIAISFENNQMKQGVQAFDLLNQQFLSAERELKVMLPALGYGFYTL